MNNFCDAKTACQILNCSDRTLLRYRQQNKHIEGIHWGRNPSGKILYNHVLLNQLITCNGEIDYPDYHKLIQSYQQKLPENQHKKPSPKRVTNLVVLAGWPIRHSFRTECGHYGRWGLPRRPDSCQIPNHAKLKCVGCCKVCDNQSLIQQALVSSSGCWNS